MCVEDGRKMSGGGWPSPAHLTFRRPSSQPFHASGTHPTAALESTPQGRGGHDWHGELWQPTAMPRQGDASAPLRRSRMLEEIFLCR